MRADRLLAILLLLQAHGQMTAGKLAEELAVSVRTIYRDMDALCMAGVPVYGLAGPDGGYALVDNYRMHLTGLNEGEVRALFMLGNLAPLVDLGLSEELRAALRKLSAALPNIHIADQTKVQQFFHFDSHWWRQGNIKAPQLQAIQEAIWADRKLFITYQSFHTGQIIRLVAPYGLVVKAGEWYFVYARENDKVIVQRVSELQKARLSTERFERPADFNLRKYWEAWSIRHERSLTDFRVDVRVAPQFIPILIYYFGSAIQEQINPMESKEKEANIQLELAFESFEDARARILGFGNGVEVLAPQALRLSMVDYAEQIVKIYNE